MKRVEIAPAQFRKRDWNERGGRKMNELIMTTLNELVKLAKEILKRLDQIESSRKGDQH